MKKRIVIVAGGTGGHVIPALVVAQKFKELGHDVYWIGSKYGVEATRVSKENIPFYGLRIRGLRSKNFFQKFFVLFKALYAFFISLFFLLKIRPSVVIGFGGYASGPAGLAAVVLRKPLVLHEQNIIPGLTNRILVRFATRILQAFPNTFLKKDHPITTGTPIRESIIRCGQQKEWAPHDVLHLLILGGSQGARSLNEKIPEIICHLPEESRPEIWHQTGVLSYADAKSLYEKFHVKAQISDFIEQMEDAYAWADIVISRSGGSTLFEMMALGLPSVLIPFPHAADDHQRRNAEYLVSHQAAICLTQNDYLVTTLLTLIKQWGKDRSALAKMSMASRRLARPDACELVVQSCLEVCREK